MIITIDGPAGSGKSTVAKNVAHKLNLYYIASGSLYRALSYILLHRYGYSLKTINNPLEKDIVDALDQKHFKYSYNNASGEKIFFDGLDISSLLKSELVSSAASIMATNKKVNHHLVLLQRLLAHERDVIIDGRNCGTEVFPLAHVKIYMTASEPVRAQRWQKVQEKVGNIIDLQEALAMIKERDKRDTEREVAPLKVPKDAVIIDTSALDVGQSVNATVELIHQYRENA